MGVGFCQMLFMHLLIRTCDFSSLPCDCWWLMFSHPVMSNSLQSHGLQHARPLCPSPSPKVCPNSCPLHLWCHPAISSSDTLFSFCPQSSPASGPFPVSHLLWWTTLNGFWMMKKPYIPRINLTWTWSAILFYPRLDSIC